MLLSLQIVTAVLIIAIGLATVRLMRGPTLADRVVALDVITVLAVALTAIMAIQFELRVLLDVTIVLALVSFVSAVAFAYYVERRATGA